MKYMTVIITILLMLQCSKSSNNVITGSGVIEATEVIVSAKMPGQLTKLAVKEGDAVQQNTRIGKVDDEKLVLQREQLLAGMDEMDFRISAGRATIASAQVQYNHAKKQYERITALRKNGSSTQQQLDNVEVQLKTAESQLISARNNLKANEMKKQQLAAQLKLLDKQIDDCLILSPLSGIVVEKYKQEGEFVGTGMPVVSIADLNNLWIKLYVSETDLGHINLGDHAAIRIDSFPDREFKGTVIWISPKAEFTPHNVQTKEARTDLVYAVKIEIPNPNRALKIGMPADIFVAR